MTSGAVIDAPLDVTGPDGADRRVHVEPVMGTVVSFDFHGSPPAPGGIERAVAWLHEVDARFSPYKPNSEISRLADGTLSKDAVHSNVRAVLAMCDALRVDSDGAFDARRWSADGRLDPSGLVKGWAVQRTADDLEAAGARGFAIDAGGDIVARGEPEPGGRGVSASAIRGSRTRSPRCWRSAISPSRARPRTSEARTSQTRVHAGTRSTCRA